MKRLLTRMSALATVVALGLIAIAQAQRSAEEPTPPAQPPESSYASAPAGESLAPPIMTLADASSPQHALAGQSRTNPLRSDPIRVEPVSSDSALAYPPPPSASSFGPPATYPPASGPPASGPPAFASTAAAANPANPTGRYATIPDNAPLQPPAEGAFAFPQLAGPDETAGLQAAGTADASAPPAAGRYAGQMIPDAQPAEPAPFQPDLGTPSSSLPSTGIESDGNFPPAFASQSPPSFDPSGEPSSNDGTGTPGNRQLEGMQTPQLTIQKLAPAEIQVGKPATFEVQVRNTGQIAAHGVEIHDLIPRGTRLIDTTPRANRGPRGELVWSLGTMKPGDEVSAHLQVMPVEEGEIGSVATVIFTADASVRTIATRPMLKIQTDAPSEVLIGEELTLTVTISNPGSGTATGVVIEELVPAGLQHEAGTELEYDIGDLKPNESRQLQLVLVADRPGLATNVLKATGDANLEAQDQRDIEVVAPRLDVALDGPKRRYLEREATYTLTVSNPGTAPAREVSLVAHLPAGLKFVSANNAGQYNEASRTVHWQLEELPIRETGQVKLVAMPIEAGEQTLRISGKTDLGLAVEREQSVLVEGIAAILFEVVDLDDPIEVGGETTYEVRVLNQGSKAATNVQITMLLPPEMRAVAAEGPPGIRNTVQGQTVRFEGLSRLAPKADTTYRIRVQGLQPGDQRIRIQLTTDEIPNPVTKEESTQVYSDE